MIISHKYKFIFLRTEKTAGTALSDALREQIDDSDDVIASFQGRWARRITHRSFHPGGLKRSLPRLFGLHIHAKAEQVRAALGDTVFNSYFKFAVERNPWDRQVSLYFHRALVENYKQPDFNRDMSSAIYRVLYYTKLRNWEIYSINQQVVADRVLRYENLAQEVSQLSAILGLPKAISLNRLNPGYGGHRRHYSHFYSRPTRDLIGRWYRKEIEQFGYAFETE